MATLVFFAAARPVFPGRPCGSKKVLGSGRLSGVTVTGFSISDRQDGVSPLPAARPALACRCSCSLGGLLPGKGWGD